MTRRHTPKTHADLGAGMSLCGTLGITVHAPPPLIPRTVTCRLCQRKWAGACAAIAEAAESARRAAIPPAVHVTPWASGIHVNAEGRRIVQRSIDGEDRSDEARWGTWRSALAALAANRDAGVPLASTSLPDRFERGKMGSGQAGSRPAPGTDHDLVDIAHAWDRACVGATADVRSAGVRYDGAPLTESAVRSIAELRLWGRPEVTRIPGRVPVRSRIIPSPVEAGAAWDLTAREVAIVVRAVLVHLDAQRVARVHVARRVEVRAARGPREWDPNRGRRAAHEGESTT